MGLPTLRTAPPVVLAVRKVGAVAFSCTLYWSPFVMKEGSSSGVKGSLGWSFVSVDFEEGRCCTVRKVSAITLHSF